MRTIKTFQILMIVSVVMAAGLATARLGETDVEIAARYGPEIAFTNSPDVTTSTGAVKRVELATNFWASMYSFKNYYVGVIYSNNVSVIEMISPVEGRVIYKPEREDLLKLIGGDGQWIRETNAIHGIGWMNPSNQAYGHFEEHARGQDYMVIMTRPFAAKRLELKNGKLEGF